MSMSFFLASTNVHVQNFQGISLAKSATEKAAQAAATYYNTTSPTSSSREEQAPLNAQLTFIHLHFLDMADVLIGDTGVDR